MLRQWVTWIFTSALAIAIMLVLALMSRAGIAASAPSGLPDPLLIDDFEDGDLIAASGSGWITLADELFGGTSTARLSPITGGARGSRGALRISGTVGASPGAIASAWTPALKGAVAADVSHLTGLRLKLRGSGDVLIGIYGGPSTRLGNFMGRVTARRSWTTVTIPFARLVALGKDREQDVFNAREVRYVGVASAAGASGPFAVEIDDLSWIGPRGSAGPRPEPGAVRFQRSLVADDAAPLRDLPWRELGRDDAGDGKPRLPDARALFAARDEAHALVWFRIDLQDPLPAGWIGVNLALDDDGDPGNGPAWWGQNTAFHFDRLVSAWVFQVGDHYEGSVGIVPGSDATGFRMTNDREVHLALDRSARRVYIGVPASELGAPAIRMVAAVGSAMVHADDLPNTGAVDPAPALTGAKPDGSTPWR